MAELEEVDSVVVRFAGVELGYGGKLRGRERTGDNGFNLMAVDAHTCCGMVWWRRWPAVVQILLHLWRVNSVLSVGFKWKTPKKHLSVAFVKLRKVLMIELKPRTNDRRVSHRAVAPLQCERQTLGVQQ